MDFLHLQFTAPMMSFGGPVVDNYGVIQRFPGLGMLAGLFANALGYDHRDFDLAQRLQSRLVYGARVDKAGVQLQDFQTVDFGFAEMGNGWTTRGRCEGRGGGSSKNLHLRFRDFWIDSIVSVVVSLHGEAEPSLTGLQAQLVKPARPLFLGRESCLPSEPIFVGTLSANSVLEALENAPLHGRADRKENYRCLLGSTPEEQNARVVVDGRNWENQIIVGERWVVEKLIDIGDEP